MVSTVGIKLVDTRFTHLSAEVGNIVDAKGGNLEVNIKTNIKVGADKSNIIGEVDICVTGRPKESKTEKEFSFKVIVKVAGKYKIDAGSEAFDTKKISNRQALVHPMVVLGVSEVRALGQKLGFPNINLPWDIKTFNAISEQEQVIAQKRILKPKRISKGSTKTNLVDAKS